jgi:hypothetical protein
MKKSMVLTVVAGLACAGAAFAQAIPGVPFEVDRSQIQQIYVNEYGEPTAPYADRAIGVVHDGLNGTTTPLCAVYLNQAAAPQPLVSILEDLNFSPGPWASTTNNVVRIFTVSISNSAASGTINFDLRMRFWDPAVVDFTRNPMITAGATPLREIIYPVRNLGPGLFNITFTLTATGQFTVPGNRVFFQGEALQPGSTTAYFMGTQIPFWGVNPNGFVAQRGGSSNSQGFDRNRNGIFEGSATPGNTLEHSALNFPGGACINTNVHYPMVIQGDLPATPPATFMDLGSITDSSTMNFTIPANGVKWFRFNLPADVTDAALRFLDIDTEGSSIADTDMALFDNNGNIIRADAGDGSGDLARLTFGVGRRSAPAGGGKSFDGGDGELAAGGPFWLAITSGPTAFSGGYVADNTGAGGNATINIRSNVVSGNLAPSVAPAGEDLVADLGDVLAPGVAGTPTLPGAYNIMWYKFNVCQDITPSGTDYFDIDFSNNDQLGDTEAFIFNAAGNLVVTSDDADADGMDPFYLAPQFSFGPSGNPRPSANPNAQPFDGQDGTLLRGTYYLGVSFYQSTTLGTNDRWHIRVTGGSNLEIAPDFYTTISSCTPACIADVDDGTGTGTPDGGVTIDDLLYYLGIFSEGNVAADVDDGTGTGTRDGGVTIDDLLYYLVRYEGGC